MAKKKKVPLTKEQVKARWGMAGCIIAIILLAILIAVAIIAMLNGESVNALNDLSAQFKKVAYAEGTQLVPTLDSDGDWTFVTDKDFKVLQITDVHIGGGCASAKKDTWALNAVAAMVSAEKPDLVVITGDIAFPVPYAAATFNNLNATQIFAKMMENLGVYWTFTYGNHDTEMYSYYTREDICKYYEESNFKYCLFQKGDDKVSGFGNSVIKVKNTQGVVTQALVLFDSHSYKDDDPLGILWKYDNIHQDQVDWYVSKMNKINADNLQKGVESKVKNTFFFHIPLPEYRTAWGEYVDNGNKDTENVKFDFGVMGEHAGTNTAGQKTYGVCCGIGDDNLFEAGLENGLQAIFCGHDHYNNFSIIYKGVRLTYSKSIDYLAYPGIWQKHSQRGCTVINFSPDGNYTCKSEDYYQQKYGSAKN